MNKSQEIDYHLRENGEFVITDYNHAKPFSSFFPGIAGMNGIPMWVFYVNRGQCISGMGIRDKNHPIMEFFPANAAYQQVSQSGFRTFVKIADDLYEPFQNKYRDRNLQKTQKMIISSSHLRLEEENKSLGLSFTVDYFTIPEESFAGFVRVLTLKNISNKTHAIEGLDGLPVIVPYGVDNHCLKNMRRTIEAFVEVCNLERKVPFFKAKVEPADRPDVVKIDKGNFYLGFEYTSEKERIIAPVVDPRKLFGTQLDFSFPEKFLTQSQNEIIQNQKTDNQFPCAMGMFSKTIDPLEEYKYISVIGNASSLEMLNGLTERISSLTYIDSRRSANNNIIEQLTQNNLICSGEESLNQYTRQNFLDNLMRGGYPVTIEGKKEKTTLYLYSRKHGDMERDYNEFQLAPTPFSQGNGNFRDINQNRRSDLFFNPDLKDENIRYFYNLIQLDGYNPLILKETNFQVHDHSALQKVLSEYIPPEKTAIVTTYFNEPFNPGSLIQYLNENGIVIDSMSFLGDILGHCTKQHLTEHGEGYWVDHWTYNLDLLENYLALYPEEIIRLLIETKEFTFYDSQYRVIPAQKKYVLWENKPMQLGSVSFDKEKEKLLSSRERDKHLVRKDRGNGEVYKTTLFVKILSLITNKMATLDPLGVGVEMEAGKPGWYDALNGLPGLFGSSVCETLEIRRNIKFLLATLEECKEEKQELFVYTELHDFIDSLHNLLVQKMAPFDYWKDSNRVKEEYRESTRFGVEGKEKSLEIDKLIQFFNDSLAKLEYGLEKAIDEKSKLINTYYKYDVVEYKEQPNRNKSETHVPIEPLEFKQVPLPLFLEGIVHQLRCCQDKQISQKVVSNLRKTDLYDDSLKMYKVNASLDKESTGIGRARIFTPGWLENESIWLHMEYKYMLELIRNGLYEEFYADFKNVFIPFLNPEIYGRSILENSSFIVSSVHSDSSIHGNGFVARLSGATAEFINILVLMTVGAKPFYTDTSGHLCLQCKPALPGWLFTKKEQMIQVNIGEGKETIIVPKDSFGFMFLGEIFVTYSNKKQKDTFGQDSVSPKLWKITDKDGNVETYKGNILSGAVVLKIRERKIRNIEIILE